MNNFEKNKVIAIILVIGILIMGLRIIINDHSDRNGNTESVM